MGKGMSFSLSSLIKNERKIIAAKKQKAREQILRALGLRRVK